MEIIQLELKGYKRFFLNNIDYIKYKPKSNVQIIASRNGSGKTSLLRMLSPLPADLKKEFNEDGYKRIILKHNKKEYEISSGYYVKGKHSFKINGEEQNMSGIKKIQLELVERHFSLTPDIFNILLGQINFSTMSVSERKHWLTEISHIDYNFAISTFIKLKQRHRDIVGGIKLLQDNILKIENDLITDIELSKLIKDKEMLNKFIEYLLSVYDSNVTISNYETEINKLESNFKLLRNTFNYIRENKITVEIVKEYEYKKKLLETTISELEDIKKKLSDTDKTTNLDLKELEDLKNKIVLKIEELKKKNKYNLDLDNIHTINEKFVYVYSEIISLISELSKYDDVYIEKENRDKLIKQSEIIKNKINIISNRIKAHQEQIDIIKSNKTENNKIKCHNCGTEFYKDYDAATIVKYQKTIEELSKALDKLSSKDKELDEILNNITNKIRLLEEIKSFFKNSLFSNLYSAFMEEYNNGYSNVLISNLDKISLLLNELSNYKKLNEKLNIVESDILKSKLKDSIEKEYSLKNLEKLLVDKTNLITKLSSELEDMKIKISKLNSIKELQNKLSNNLHSVYSSFNKNIKITRNKYIKELISIIKDEVIRLDSKIENNKYNKDKYKKDLEELSKLKMTEKVLKITIKELSPTEGLIAENINGFLNKFIEDINFVINSVWTYDMKLLPCEIGDGNDLNYKFKVKVDNNEVIEDISKLSSSMQEITNLAFRVVFMKYMGLTSYPLILDEFGKTMDDTHRIAAYNVIDKLTNSEFNQVFIVSHFNSVYGRFTNADFNILDINNIEIGDITKYNSSLEIKYEYS